MIEQWKDIRGYEKLYQVSNLGKIRHKAEATKPAVTKPEPLHLKSIDEVLEEAKAAGYSPEDYGKYKAAKALAKAGPIDTNIPNAKPRVAEYDIRQESGYESKYEHDPETLEKEDDMICKNCGFDVEPEFDEGRVGCPACDSNAPEDCIDELFETEPEEPDMPDIEEPGEGLAFANGEIYTVGVDIGKAKDDSTVAKAMAFHSPKSRPPFIIALEELMMMSDDWLVPSSLILPIAQEIVRKGIVGEIEKDNESFKGIPGTDPAWGFDRKPMGGSK